jgi:RNA-directed DNA polymerase
MFMAFPFEYPPPVATFLAHICCHDNQLPHGAPTSPIVSNFICRRMDAELARLARTERCYYTRYADDICFSTTRKVFPGSLATANPGESPTIGAALAGIISQNGFSLSVDKTSLRRQSQRQRVTGLVVNQKPNIARDYIWSLRNLLYIWERYGEEAAEAAFAPHDDASNRPPAKPPAQFRHIVQGRVQHVGSVKGWTHPVYRRLAYKLQSLDDSFAPRTLRALDAPQPVRIYTEGESDAPHLQAADAYFKTRNEFTNLILEFPADSSAGGGGELLKLCSGLALTPQATPCICIFDRDDPPILQKAVGGASTSRDLGNGGSCRCARTPRLAGSTAGPLH